MDWDHTVPLPCFYLAAKIKKVLVFHSSSGCPVGGGPQYIHLSSVLPPFVSLAVVFEEWLYCACIRTRLALLLCLLHFWYIILL